MRTLLHREFDLYRKAEKVDEVVSRRGALLALLNGAVAVQEDDDEADRSVRSPGPRWLPGDQDDCRREVLDLLLSEAPNCLAFPDVAVALAGDPENRQEANALRDAITVLVGAGLARRRPPGSSWRRRSVSPSANSPSASNGRYRVPPLRVPREEDPWDPRQDGDGAL
jgi:hypothetical protein